MANVTKIQLPSGNEYSIRDAGALPLTGGTVTGPTNFGDSVSIDEATIGDLIVNGNGNFTNGIKADTYNGGHPTYFIKGTQTATTNVWTGTLPDGVTYYNGLTIDYLLPYAGNSSAATLNLSGLGAKPVYYGNSATGGTTTHYGANTVIHLTYVIDSAFNSGNGCWKASNYYDSNTVDRLRDSYFRPYAGEAIYRYKFVMQGADNRVYPITVTNQADATQVAKVPTQVGLRPGRIWYYNTTTTVSAGAVLGSSTLDSAYQTTIGVYNFNTDIAAYRMLYLRGTYNKTTDLFTLYKDSSSPCTSYYTQVPTNTANITLSSYFTSGYYYMLLGGTYSSANYISLFEHNPLYYFDGTNLIPVSTKVAQDTVPTTAASHTTGITASTTATKTTLGTAFTIPNVTNKGSASSWTFEEKTIPNVTAAGSGSFTSGSFSGGSGSFSATVSNHVLSFSHTHTAATHGADSHTHTAPTIGTAIKVQSKSGGSNGSAPTLGTAFTVPNVTGNTSATVSITDNGHTHSLT